jgi:1,4-alpha-glucan branching enzyme
MKYKFNTMKKLLIVLLVAGWGLLTAQTVTLNPTITPSLFQYNDQITVTYDVTGTALATLSDAWIWVWIPGKNIDAKYNINPAAAAADPAKFTKSVVSGVTKWTKTFKPSDFFTADISNEKQVGVLLKASDWPGGKTTDYIANFGFKISLVAPTVFPLAVLPADVLNINATAPAPANFQLLIDGNLVDSKTNLTNYTYAYTVPAAPLDAEIKIMATAVTGGATSDVSFQYVIKQNSPNAVRPAGIIAGINYGADPTKVTLCFWAPAKTSVYVFGDFSDWEVKSENLMNRDGDYFWKELTGLTSGQEYGFQYWVQGSLKIAEPFADKILDPDDQYIPEASYPNLKSYPAKALSGTWYNNRVSVFQTNQSAYAWQTLNFQKPKKESLIIYEVLLRDFFDNGNRNYQTLIDTIPYFKRLGVNAIQLMPIMEFNGNESWGYNPTFMFAPDKYYGTKSKLKEFIDTCHLNGIAVIFDIAMNHQDMPNSLLMQDFNFTTFKPNGSNRWFNVTAPHPYSVFFDMNHSSLYTQKYLDTITYHWINEYKIDGYRFDLSKGFTQTVSNESTAGNYDASRIAILKRMADKIWSHTPNAYVILEHFAAESEEKELAEYKANEGKGMMLWGKMTDQYNQNTMGYNSNTDIARIYHGTRGWSTAHLVGYMESHDEERLMYKNLQFGNVAGNYSAKLLSNALKRMEAANTLFYTIPGPKMLWQFGELGFDYSINRCDDGTLSGDCRLSIKPTVWEYMDDYERYRLFAQAADLIRLKKGISAFQDGTAIFSSDNLVKQVIVKNKEYTTTPVDSTQMSAVMVANFELQSKSVVVNFPHPGTWYEYYTGESLNVTGNSATITLSAGAYRMFTNVQLVYGVVTALQQERTIHIYPNPVSDFLTVDEPGITDLTLYTVMGVTMKPERVGDAWDVRTLPAGLYVGSAQSQGLIYRFKILIRR